MDLLVKDLDVARGGVPVLRAVTFHVVAGEALVLRGPNGSGKTTLLRTLAGLQPPLRGQISVDREDMAYAAHADGLKATLSVAENLKFWADLHRTGGIDATLDAFALTDLRDRPAGALSAGQKRRLGLARMLVTGRRVWVLDEPTVSLDRDAVDMFVRAVRAHLEGGGMAVIATHIDLGLEARVLDISGFRATAEALADTLDEAYF